MIGTDLVSLAPATKAAYDAIWEKVIASPDRELWFGPMPAGKAIRSKPGDGGRFFVLTMLFFVVGVALFFDAFGDIDSAWNRWNLTFFFLIQALIVIGFITALLSFFLSEGAGDGWKRHRFIVQIGDTRPGSSKPLTPIGVADIWQDSVNGVCVLDCSLLADFRGRKLGSIATRMMIRKCFTELDARRVESSTVSTNLAAIKMNDRMVEEGILKGKWLVQGQPTDEHLYRLLKSEWLDQLAAKRH